MILLNQDLPVMKGSCLELSPLQAQVEFFDADVFSDPSAAEEATDCNQPVLSSPSAGVTRLLILAPMPAPLPVHIYLFRPFLSSLVFQVPLLSSAPAQVRLSLK
jgi:hypothetical protein